MRTDLTKEYGIYDNLPDQNSTDFHQVMDWLKAHGAGDYAVSFLPAGGVNQSFTPAQMVLTFAFRPQTAVAAYLTLNSPLATLLAIGLGKDANGVQIEEYHYVRQTPPTGEVPANPNAHTDNLVGAKSYVDANGKQHYFGNPDTPFIPTTITYDGKLLRSLSYPVPFGRGRSLEWVEV